MTFADNSSTFWSLVICVVVGIPAGLILGVSISGKVLRALRSGIAISASRAEYRRAEVPSLYWLTLSLQGFNALGCLLLAAVMAGFVVLCFIGTRQGHNVSRPMAEIMALEAAAESYKADYGHYPTGDDAAISRALAGPNPDHKIYIEWPAKNISLSGAFLDPWGTPYRFKSGQFLDIQSAGPNRRFEDPHAKGSDDLSTE